MAAAEVHAWVVRPILPRMRRTITCPTCRAPMRAVPVKIFTPGRAATIVKPSGAYICDRHCAWGG